MAAGDTYQYVGDELSTFALATNWKARLAREIRPYLGREILEVGAGLGETAKALITSRQECWTLLEPDAALAEKAAALVKSGQLPARADAVVGVTADLDPRPSFDSVIYVDVLEHIERDAEELARAACLLRPGGHIVVLSPAHQWLYSEFDARIGHCRRYSRRSLLATAPPGVTLVRLRYLDAAGMSASIANRLVLRQGMPTSAQVLFWDRRLVPVSRFVDPLLGYRVGKSILAVWRRDDSSPVTRAAAAR
jgi:SAM-dependent methyltransferase